MSEDLLLRIATALERIATALEASSVSVPMGSEEPEPQRVPDPKLDMPWHPVVTDRRIRDFLTWRKAKTVGDVIAIPDYEILKILQVGPVRLHKMRRQLDHFLDETAA